MIESSSFPPEFYPIQAELAAQELDFELTLAAAQATGQPLPVAQTVESAAEPSQIYNLNAILDAITDD